VFYCVVLRMSKGHVAGWDTLGQALANCSCSGV
jgi:hypothetical protein